jgi:ribosomal protein S18 acetylase RimI-like enzyme
MVTAWNQSLPGYLETTEDRLAAHLAGDPNFDPEGCIGAFTHGNEIAGFVIAKRWRIPNHDMAQDDANQWTRDGTGGIGMICVVPALQRRGIGTLLMQASEKFFKKNQVAVVTIGREPGRHFLPGVPESLEDTLEFFEKCGYHGGFQSAIDIIGDISNITEIPGGNAKLASKIEQNKAKGFAVMGYMPALRDKLLQFMKIVFPGNWYWRVACHVNDPVAPRDELQLLVDRHGNDLHVHGFALTATQASASLGPATIVQSHGSPAFGGLGPIGIVKEMRGSRGLGAMLLHHALVNLHRKGVTKVLIDWT